MSTPERFSARCHYCGLEMDTRDLGIYQWTAGWVLQRAGGGGHGISLPQRENRWAHGICVERAVKGTLAQGEMHLW